MRVRLLVALAAGVVLALGVSIAAHASGASISATSDNHWDPSTVTIQAGEAVNWSNAGGFHNVCVQKPGNTGTSCDEFRNGDPGPTWTSASHTFTTPGTYTFYCEEHKNEGMTGTITVEAPSTTGTTGTGTQPTDTTPTQTQTNTMPAPDTTAPRFVGRPKHRSSKKALILDFSSTEAGKLEATVSRRAPHAHAFKQSGHATVNENQGHNVIKLPRKAGGFGRAGAYRVKLRLVDAAGNTSPTTTLSYKIS
jgi:plastocyanin